MWDFINKYLPPLVASFFIALSFFALIFWESDDAHRAAQRYAVEIARAK